MAGTVVIGVDLGGTDIKAGLVDADGAVLESCTVATEAAFGAQHVLARIIELIKSLAAAAAGRGEGVTTVGLGAPGPINSRRGSLVSPPNLPGWHEVPVVEYLSAATGVRVILENDANAAVLGEHWLGAGRGADDVAMLTLGTGIGGGIILGGRLWRGRFENAAEIGHTIVVLEGRLCNCGQRGCLEAYASASTTAARAAEAIAAGEASSLGEVLNRAGLLTAADVAAAARVGDALARRVWDETCRYLAMACVNLQHLLNFERIILAGGMCGSGAALLEPVRAHFERLMWPDLGDRPEILLAALGNRAGYIGAAYCALQAGGVAHGGGSSGSL